MSNIPGGWSWRVLGEIAQEQSLRVGHRREVKVLSSTKHHGLVPSDEYFKNRTIYSSDLSSYKLVPRGYFAYATNHLTEGSIGLQNQFDLACVSPVYTVFSCDVEQVDVEYMFRLLKSPPLMAAYGVHEQASVDRRGAIRYRDFERIGVLLPPKAEQRRIAEILDSLDAYISQVGKIIEKLSMVEAGLLDGMFKGLSRLDGEVQSARLDEIAQVERGRFVYRPRNDPRYYGGDFPFIQTGDVAAAKGGSIERCSQTLNALGLHGSRMFPAGTIAVTIAATIGETGILERSMCFPDSVVGVTVREPYSNRYVELCLRQAKRQFVARAPQSAQANINLEDLRPFRIPIPDPSQQYRIADIYESHAERLAAERRNVDKLRALKQGLAEDLLTGRVRVPEAEAEAMVERL